MALIEAWFNQDLQQPVKVRYLDGNVFSQDNNGNLIGVRVFDGGETAVLSGSVSASVIRADGSTVAVAGSRSGNECYVIMPQAAYAIPGVLSIVIKITSGTSVTTLCAVVANVYVSTTDSAVDPGTIIPSISALIASIEAAVGTIPLDYSALSNGFRDAMETAYGTSAPGTYSDVTIKRSDGTTTASTVYKTTGFIPVTGGTVLYTTSTAVNATVLSERATIAFYSSDNASGYISSEPFTSGTPASILWQATVVPSGAKFMRISIEGTLTDYFKCIQVFPIDTVLTYKGNISSSDDIDSFLTSGMWYLYTTEGGLPGSWPSDTIGTLIVRATTATNGAGTQQYILDYNGQLWSRYKRSEGFTDWRKVLNNGNILTDIEPVILPKTLSQKTTPTSAYNVNDLTSPGMYSIGDVSIASNYPSSETGRLIVFGDPASAVNRIIQMVIDNDYNVFVRYISSAVQPWFRLGTEARGELTSANDCNDYTKNGQFTINNASSLPSHWASSLTGKLIVFGDENSNTNKIVQLAIDYRNNFFLRYKSTAWTPWTAINSTITVQTLTVKSSGGDFTTVPSAVKYVMDNWQENPSVHYLIKIDAGTYDIADEVVSLIGSGMESQGLWIPPNTTICGAGKDKTIIQFHYNGSDDSIMSNVSAFNAPFESVLQDVTISVKNIRYCIHSALQPAGVSTKYIDDVTIRLENVKLIHLGFDDGKNPTYLSPGTYGSGSTNGGRKEFYNCEFIAKQYCPWFNHNRKGLTKATEFIFEGCSFVNYLLSGTTGQQSALHFITWTDDPTNIVIIRHCTLNRYIHQSIRTDSLGTETAHCGYYITADCDLIVIEPTTNNANLDDNYMDVNCRRDIADETITAYTPVSKNALMRVRKYNSADKIHGIALHNASAEKPLVYKFAGCLPLAMLTDSTFAVGKKIGWNGLAWVEDNNNPIVEVIYSGIVQIV